MNFQISTPTWAPSFPKKCPPCNFLFTTVPLSPTMKVIVIPNGSNIDPFHLFLKCTSFTHCVLFCIQFLSLNIFLRCTDVVCICSLCFLLLSRIPLCGDDVYPWSIHPLRDIWVAASLGLLEIKLLSMFLYMSSCDLCTLLLYRRINFS